MLKRLLLIWVFSGSLDGFSQVITPAVCYHNTPACNCTNGKIVDKVPTSDTTKELWLVNGAYVWKSKQLKPDTLRAELLVTYTTRRWGIAHARDGYVVKKDGKVIRFLTDKKERFPPNTRLWGWVSCDEKVLP